MGGTILFVHGTGVRFKDLYVSLDATMATARAVGVHSTIKPCLWGDPVGIDFAGLSLPDPPDAQAQRRADAEDQSWAWRFDDPLLELSRLTTEGSDASGFDAVIGQPEWLTRLNKICAYVPGQDAIALLDREHLGDLWDPSWRRLMADEIVSIAFERSAAAGELADCEQALARAAIAMLHNAAIEKGRPGPSASLRDKLVARLAQDWGQAYGLGAAAQNLLARAATTVLRNRRNPFNHAIARQIGDILLYQSRGEDIRAFIRDAVLGAEPPVTIVAHSLGGVACVDLLAMPDPPMVAALVTVGSQAPYFYEIKALASLRPPEQLPAGFPPWYNLYDRNDFLSFVGRRLFGDAVQDVEMRSGQPFPASHSAYLTSEAAWSAIRDALPQ